jgi:flagellar FliJ protein
MSAFRFSLGRLLDLRKNEERQRATTVARAREESESARKAREDLVEIHRAGREKVAEAHRIGGAVGVLRNMELLLERVEDQVKDADQICQETDERLVESIKDYTVAVRERHSLDRLRDRRMEEWRVEEARKDQKEMDEVAITRHGRRALEAPGV